MNDAKAAVLAVLYAILETCPAECDSDVQSLIDQLNTDSISLEEVGHGLSDILSFDYEGEGL